MSASCKACKFYVPPVAGAAVHVQGQCRRMPPRNFVVGLDNFRRPLQIASFPCVAVDEWCGEFRPKLEV